MVPSARLLARIAAMEVRGRQRHWSFIPAALARRLRPRVVSVADGLATLMAASDALHVNRVVGLGRRRVAKPSDLEGLIAIYREAGLRRFRLELPPGPFARASEAAVLARGFRRTGAYALLVRDLSRPIASATAGPRVSRARRRELGEAVDIFARVFGSPPSRRAWALASVEAGHTEPFLAWAGGRPVAAGSLRVERDIAWLIGGATLPRWRHLGAHAALIDVRLRRARALGCRWAWSEASPPTPGKPSGSYRNLLRHGFEPAGEKRIFLWTSRARMPKTKGRARGPTRGTA